MLRTVAMLPFFIFATGASADVKDLVRVCERPIVLSGLLGPKLVSPKAAEIPNIVKLMMKHSPKADPKDEVGLNGMIKTGGKVGGKAEDGGVFISTPFTRSQVEADTAVNEICVIFGVGGVVLPITSAIKSTEDLRDKQEQEHQINEAIEVSDNHCFDSFKLDTKSKTKFR